MTRYQNDMKALIIDDEQDICLLLTKILNGIDVKTSFANSLKEGKFSYLKVHPDIVFLDINLADGNSIKSIKDFKSADNNNKVVMITATESNNERQDSFNQGADAFLIKPFTGKQIIDVINNFKSTTNDAHINN